ncbi:hypothetical protein QFC22_000151 [Naganishia vaughanmartiniae]|uniref:Uncharacterized protein n=1 Tax=Naganishia vaughanmartiniae TaxID=1424756 RepID=A0ACC2XMJ1_9TREE|nr:hypothetical protein QFC22_000151 [Naganishia vaughanmartiniae]
MKEDMAALCPECQAVEPWVEENDEHICQRCGYIEKGLEAAKFRDEGEYVNPLVDIYLKNPAFQNETGGPSKRNRYGTEISQRVQSRTDLFDQIDGCVRNTLRLPNIVSHRAWNMLEIIREKRGKKNVTQGMKLLAMSVTLVAAREAGHSVPNSSIASLTRRSLADIQADLRLICKLLDKRYEEYRGSSEQTQIVVSAAAEIAQQYQQKNLADSVLANKEFTSTLQFCLAYQPRIHLIEDSISQLQRFIQLTGIWHRRKLEICDIATVFIALQLIAVRYIRYPSFLMNDFRKYVNFNPEACQLRMREFQRLTLDLAFYLPQIGKARFIPELLEPWNGRTTRPVPEGQLYVLLLPDVLDNMQQLWEMRLHELTLQKDNPETRDIEARLKTALSAFLTPPDVQATTTRPQSQEQECSPSRADGDERPNADTSNSPFSNLATRSSPNLESGLPLDPLLAQVDVPPSIVFPLPSNGRLSDLRATEAKAKAPSTNLETIPSADCLVDSAAPSGLSADSLTPTRCKRKLDASSHDDGLAKRVDRRSVQAHSNGPTEERRIQATTLDQFKDRITTKRTNDCLRSHSRQEIANGVLAPARFSSARAAYGTGNFAHQPRTRLLQRLPQVLRVLQEWQSVQLAEPRRVHQEPAPPYRSCYEYDTYWLKKDLRDGKAASSINIHRFPPSLTMAKAMLRPFDFASPVIGSHDDGLFEPGELESYLGDDEYTKCRLEIWHAQGMEEIATRRAAVSQRAIEIASQRQPRIVELAGLKPSEGKYNMGRLTELLASLRDVDNGDVPYEHETYIAREVGQAISSAVDGSAEDYKVGIHNNYSRSNSSKEDDVSGDEANEKPDDEGLEIIGDYEMPLQVLAHHRQRHEDEEDGDEYTED